MNRINIDVLSTSDVQFPTVRKVLVDNITIYFSESQDGSQLYGVEIILNNNMNQSVTNFAPYLNVILIITLFASKTKVNITQVFDTTRNKSDNDTEIF